MDENIREKIRTLIKEQGTCVLATASKNRPYCSLMAYATNESCNEIYLMTLNEGRKYQNLCENPAVSLLIDTRRNSLNLDHAEGKALTVSGRFERVQKDPERERIRRMLSLEHPGLKDFFENPKGEPVKIIIESYLLLEGPTTSHYGDVSDLQP
jgi:nitroimidazol reductase NimA-like FMN-containing flavoprotein (pyridoxamine 5'-phosphate oxidase superfamily)